MHLFFLFLNVNYIKCPICHSAAFSEIITGNGSYLSLEF